ncbi:MAG: DNA-directed RNA polymerase subunit A', partial [Candidatus Thorarchaeota archaeon]|nr:DNA-directed RNA polymerase subunit A' [Candidatus Thorarchaeota archaeon]
IEPGFIVERHLANGDIVLFNRQPSLHRMSIMAHEVRVMPYRTFRLSLYVCPPYNADFDGDEMNLHVPQSEESRAEARVLMRVQEQILSPRYGGPIIGALQDYISSAFLLTRKSNLLTKDQVNQLLATANYELVLPPPAIKAPVELWTGKQIFSIFIPEGINISFKANICRKCTVCKREDCDFDSYVVVRDGNLIFGVVDEKAFGAGEPDSLFHRIIKEKGSTTARIFLDSVGKLLVRLITDRGFSMGLNDVTLPRAASQRIKRILSDADAKVNQLIETYQRGELDPNPGQTLLETLEQRIMATLAEARDSAGAVAGEHLGLENTAVIMAQTGARGSRLNLSQMAAVVGQQAVRGERISRGYVGRTLPHFERGNLGARARGFVTSSYKSGLDPIEYWFHAAGGREGLVDTAVRTSTSGYMQRRLMTALQDLKVETDGTVRTAPGRIVQFRFGDDGVDPSKSDHGRSVNIDIVIEKVLGKARIE